ncbi:hypothetical protein pneo_cds_863 [Pandoravirus neocaledonia]|uniref:Uncharacterized protein n=1 Tax=Pandoravirus neocaledonia TaxID=2107708 RepID=A0A2U7UDR4_9VIRU|nr:hypothetical protein pneo_cds_863 [Pandoravirus neocaledonia]AVK76470.1 hypothetical protein pneo_cds_863 [Pandoravirus neocaledonia]
MHSPLVDGAAGSGLLPPMNRHQRRAQAAIARKAAAAAAAKAEREQESDSCAEIARAETQTTAAETARTNTQEGKAADQAARRAERKIAFQAALRRGLLAMMTEYAQNHYGAWWITGLDKILRNRIYDGFAAMDPELRAIGIIRDAARGWWRWPASASAPVFDVDSKFTRVIPRTPVARVQTPTGAPSQSARASEGPSKRDAIKQAVKAARKADNVAFRAALCDALKALMTDYCQERFGGAWWVSNLDTKLRRRLQRHYSNRNNHNDNNGRVDFDLLDIKSLRDACHGWWKWSDDAGEPVFCEDAPRPAPAEKAETSAQRADADGRPNAPSAATKKEVAHPRPVPSGTTRRKHARLQHKQRPAGAVVRGRPVPA